MKFNDLINAIKNDKIESSYIFTGEEEYLMSLAINRLKDKYINPSFENLNFISIDEKESDFEDILNACETLPFMSDKKIVVVKDIGKMLENDSSDLSKKLGKYIETLGDYLILILVDKSNNLKKTTSIYKNSKKLGRVVDFDSLRGRELNNWVETIARRKEKTISSANINYFLNKSTYSNYRSDKNLYDLENELLKVISYSGKDEIEKESIDMVLIKTLDNNIFDLLKHISSRNSSAALNVFDEIHQSKEPVQRVVYMIIRHLRLLLMYKLYREKGYTENDTRGKMKISPYEFKNIGSQSGGFTQERLLKALDEILELDEKLKTSSLDEKLALEVMIVKLCQR